MMNRYKQRWKNRTNRLELTVPREHLQTSNIKAEDGEKLRMTLTNYKGHFVLYFGQNEVGSHIEIDQGELEMSSKKNAKIRSHKKFVEPAGLNQSDTTVVSDAKTVYLISQPRTNPALISYASQPFTFTQYNGSYTQTIPKDILKESNINSEDTVDFWLTAINSGIAVCLAKEEHAPDNQTTSRKISANIPRITFPQRISSALNLKQTEGEVGTTGSLIYFWIPPENLPELPDPAIVG